MKKKFDIVIFSGYLKGQGRARGWSDKQKLQNLWTKRGYDLVYKACDCSCGHGHLKKDLDWMPPVQPSVQGADGAVGGHDGAAGVGPDAGKRKRKKSKSSLKPTITIGLPAFGVSTQQQVRAIYFQTLR